MEKGELTDGDYLIGVTQHVCALTSLFSKVQLVRYSTVSKIQLVGKALILSGFLYTVKKVAYNGLFGRKEHILSFHR